MATKKLTTRTVRALSTTKDRETFWDSGFSGASFGVRVSGRTGSKTFVLKYHLKGKQRKMTLGQYPGMTLAQARSAAKKVVGRIQCGEDPAKEKQEAKRAETFSEVADQYLKLEGPGLADRSLGEYRRIIEKDLRPRFGDMKMREIERGHVIDLLDEIRTEREATVMANRTRARLGRIFEFAIKREIVEANPVANTEVQKESPRGRWLSESEIRAFWTALDDEQEPVASLFRFLLLTGQRSSETKALRWDEIEDDVWTIPREKTKSDRAHRVPLSSAALDVLEGVRGTTGDKPYVFASPKTGEPMRWTWRALERIRERAGIDDFTTHDLRRTWATHMALEGVVTSTIERAQNRKDHTVASIYDRYRREPEVRDAFEKWGEKVERIIEGKEKDEKVAGRIDTSSARRLTHVPEADGAH